MTIAEALKKYSKIEADLLLAHVLKQPKEFLYLHPMQKLTAKQALSFNSMTTKRLKGMPAAYLLGYKHFYGLKFKVNNKVLIPRPESEWIVDKGLEILRSAQDDTKKIKVLEIGTGSGCIAIALAKNSVSDITAIDISEQALKVAKANAKTHNAKVKFIKSNLLQKIKGKFDIVIANLPYVPHSDYKKFLGNLKHEPKLALTDGTDEFVLIKKFLGQTKDHLAPKGYLILETDPTSIKILRAEIKKVFGKQIKIIVTKDIHGLERFIVAH